MESKINFNRRELFSKDNPPIDVRELDESTSSEDYSSFEDEFRANGVQTSREQPQEKRQTMFLNGLQRFLLYLIVSPVIICLFSGLQNLLQNNSKHRSRNHFFSSDFFGIFGLKKHQKSNFLTIPYLLGLLLWFLSVISFIVLNHILSKRRNVELTPVESVDRMSGHSFYSSDEELIDCRDDRKKTGKIALSENSTKGSINRRSGRPAKVDNCVKTGKNIKNDAEEVEKVQNGVQSGAKVTNGPEVDEMVKNTTEIDEKVKHGVKIGAKVTNGAEFGAKVKVKSGRKGSTKSCVCKPSVSDKHNT